MTILLLLAIIALSGGLAGFLTGTLCRTYSLGGLANTVFGVLGGMVFLKFINSVGIAPAVTELALTNIAFYTGCGILGGATLALFAGFVQKTA